MYAIFKQRVITTVNFLKIENENDILRLEKAVLEKPNGLRLGSAHPQGGNRMVLILQIVL
jgi:hypothetical protein